MSMLFDSNVVDVTVAAVVTVVVAVVDAVVRPGALIHLVSLVAGTLVFLLLVCECARRSLTEASITAVI